MKIGINNNVSYWEDASHQYFKQIPPLGCASVGMTFLYCAKAPAGAYNDIVIEKNKLFDVAGLEIWVTSTRGLILCYNDYCDRETEIKIEQCEDVVSDRHRR